MPGLSLKYKRSSNNANFKLMLDSLLYLDRYSKKILYNSDFVSLGATGYKSYPIARIETNSLFIVLEGYLYQSENTRETITTVADAIVQANKKEVREWLSNRDGEFLITVIEKESENVYILNDPLGRLPYYMMENNHSLLASRELGFILDNVDADMDSQGVAETLLFGYPLGNRTLYDGVDQVEPGSLVSIKKDSVAVEQVYCPRIDTKQNHDRSVEENAEQLATLFSRACKSRSDLGGRNVISLSGGLDSRAIAACFSANNLSFVASTFDRADGRHSDEVIVAEKVMSILGGEWKQFDIPQNTGKQMSELLQMKRGMNFLDMGYIHRFFDGIIDEYGPDLKYFAGDGGDKIFPPLSLKQFSGPEDVAEHILTSQNRFDVGTVEELTGYPRSKLKSSVMERIQSYPGDNPTQKYAQFLFWERGRKWVLHGEDRNRYFFWTPAPFYSLPLVEYAMSVPDKQKKRNKLYRAMLQNLSPDIVEVEYANVGSSIDSIEYKLKQVAFDLASRYPFIRNIAVDMIKDKKNKKYNKNVASIFRTQSEKLDQNDCVISTSNLKEISENREKYNRNQVYYLLSVTSSVELLRDGMTVLDEKQDIKFE
ncbi:hypothetical protein PM085_13300 [Halorubrum ezzemoulense]|uniref:Asparagine synthetase domain-containing protein n=1 Tax=Halorubrum ezzemoulense TaxID=337243 RepID=A0ABT4Z5A8_HALEZ|nr:hypothetical protein [Halorubrum ezzemoulense]MDB2293249.1 hypothetical protein [Halorubrum ezzemoulense]